ncbi:hypothetical protein [Leadbetterella sp. DM7]|uniref:hypothetical protein n=1 Tax=Leadbetterella sp. DM7 TaxID=3235085 RepID=UPI00349ECAC5
MNILKLKYFHHYILFGICFFFLSSCQKDDVGTNKLLGKWSIYKTKVSAEGKYAVYEFDPADEIAIYNFTSDKEGFLKGRSDEEGIVKFEYFFEESTKQLKLTYKDMETSKGVYGDYIVLWEIISLTSKELILTGMDSIDGVSTQYTHTLRKQDDLATNEVLRNNELLGKWSLYKVESNFPWTSGEFDPADELVTYNFTSHSEGFYKCKNSIQGESLGYILGYGVPHKFTYYFYTASTNYIESTKLLSLSFKDPRGFGSITQDFKVVSSTSKELILRTGDGSTGQQYDYFIEYTLRKM